MLDSIERSTVLATLAQRRGWLQKQLQGSLEPHQRDEFQSTIRIIDSAAQKLAKPVSTQPAATHEPVRKRAKRPVVDPEDAYVLIAEEHADSVAILRIVLEDLGIENIDVVEDGRAALYALQNCSPPYDIVLCDWNMAEMSGLEVHKAVNNLAKLQDTHFIMVTGQSDAALIKEAISHGIDDIVAKPVDAGVLEQKLRQALSGALEQQ